MKNIHTLAYWLPIVGAFWAIKNETRHIPEPLGFIHFLYQMLSLLALVALITSP